jgi:hypothetical protein
MRMDNEPLDVRALNKRAHELQIAEWKRQRSDGAPTIDHKTSDDRVYEKLVEEGNWEKIALRHYIGRSRGDTRQSVGPQLRKHDDGQMALWRTPDVLLELGEMESAYLGDMVEKKDVARLITATRTQQVKATKALKQATASQTVVSDLQAITDDVLHDRPVEWDDEAKDDPEADVA